MNNLLVVVVDSNYLGGAALFQREQNVINHCGGKLVLMDLKTEKDIISNASEADVLLCCGNPPITRNVLKAFKGKAVLRYGIGYNSVDVNAATEYGKLVFNSPGFCSEELVMHASALILALLRNIVYYSVRTKEGIWAKGQGPVPRRLSSLTLGLFGFGASAQPMSDVFKDGFHSRVIAFDPFANPDTAKSKGVELVDFDSLLEQSDIISIHAPLTAETKHIFNLDAFKKMKSSSYIINVSRGGLICEPDLIEALQNGMINGAGLDVLEQEPISPDNPLRKMDNVVITPHSGFYGLEAVENGHVIASSLLEHLSAGEVLMHNLVNPTVLEQLPTWKRI